MKYLDGFKVENYSISGVIKKEQVKSRITASLKSGFYREIEPPTLCKFSDFRDINMSEAEQNALFKITDVDGSLLTLSFNLTLSIDEIAAFEYLKNVNKPLRLFYKGKAYTLFKKEGLDRVYDQVGAELINAEGVGADAEIIINAIRALLACKIKSETFFVEISHAGFIGGILESYSFGDDEQALLLDNVARKNTFSIFKSKENSDLYSRAEELLTSVPKLFGKPEAVLDFAGKFAEERKSQTAINTVEYIKTLYNVLKECGYGDYIRLDLTAKENHKNIYNGIMFQGMSAEIGVPLFSGGRYDGIIGRNNANCVGNGIPSVGFAISIDNVLKITKPLLETHKNQYPSAVIAYEEENGTTVKAANELIASLIGEGKTVENLFAAKKDALLSAYNNVKGVDRYFIDETGKAFKL